MHIEFLFRNQDNNHVCKQVHGSDFKVNKQICLCEDNLCYMELSFTKKQDESDREIIRDESFIQNSS